MKKQKKTNRDKITALLASGLSQSVIGKKLGISRQAVNKQAKPQEPRACACGSCGLFVVGTGLRYSPECPNRDTKRRCRCGCGAEMTTPRRQYIDGHKPETIRCCRCGCTQVVTGKYQQYLAGHKPTKGTA